MSLDPNDVDLFAFFTGGQFFEDDVEDELFACFTDGQFGIELAAARIPSPVVARGASSGGGGASYLRYAVPVGDSWDWGGSKVMADNEAIMGGPWSLFGSQPRAAPVMLQSEVSLAGQVVEAERRWDGRSALVGMVAGVAVTALVVWGMRSWVERRAAQLARELG